MIKLLIQSNLFNFTIFLLIIILIVKKVDISSMLEDFRQNVLKKVEDSKSERNLAVEALKNAELSVKNIQKNIDEISESAKENAENSEKLIMSEAENKIQHMKDNTNKLLEIEEKILNDILKSKHSAKSFALAKKHIIDTLKNNSSLQRKFIDKSLEDLEVVWK